MWSFGRSLAMCRWLFAMLIACTAMLTVLPAIATEWSPWPIKDSSSVAAGFKQDSGGTLVVVCDPNSKLLSIIYQEPRAHWDIGASIDVTIKSDDGTALPTSFGIVLGPTQLVVRNEKAFDFSTMMHSKTYFTVRVDDLARSFPNTNFRNAVEPVLQACSDHW
jgi:hypothetical protein